MFTKQLEHIFTKDNFINAFNEIPTKAKGIDEVSYTEFQNNFEKNISNLINDILIGQYIPEPIKAIEIKKPNSNEKRPIGISSIKDKLIQKVLYEDIYEYFDKLFSDKSYAYRPRKSPLKAINRVSDYIKRGYKVVYKTDIKSFFENINHEILVKILKKHISDKGIIKLLMLYIKIGGFKKINYFSHEKGVHQGDIISPLLSNIYLDTMDKFLEKHKIDFVRFGDDFIIFLKDEDELENIKKNLLRVLKLLNLTLNSEKSYLSNIYKGFSFLGVHFKGENRTIENDRLQKSFSKIHNFAKESKSFDIFLEQLNLYLHTLQNYYLKIISKNSNQYLLLKENIGNSIAQKVYLSKKNKEINKKSIFLNKLSSLDILKYFEFDTNILKAFIHKGYEKYFLQKDVEVDKLINKKKSNYSKKFASISTIHINEFGVFLGISKNKIVLKKYGKVIKVFPFSQIDRIVLEGKGFTISSDVIYRCAKHNIYIDFIDYKSNPYASITSYNSATTQNIHNQAMILNTDKHFEIAYQIIKGKLKNQINYIKYLSKYHIILEDSIIQMGNIFNKFKSIKNKKIDVLMGYEGSLASVYWSAIKLIIDIDYPGRITKGAKDIVNSSLNYGYAILYGKVQNTLIKAGLSLHISFLHSLDKQKPTLVFDMIEEFRSFVVDRTIISMINKDEPLKLDKEGLLTKKSRKLISKNIYEKLNSYTIWKKESIRIENIIERQAYNLLKFINFGTKYKPFIGKY